MKVKFNNSSLIFNVREKEVIVDLDVVLEFKSGNSYCAAKHDGTKVYSGAYNGYYVDLTGLYENGFRKVKFKANQKSHSSDVYTMGTVCTSPIPSNNSTVDTVESFIDDNIKSLSAEWYELPITSNSRCLHATYCFSNQYAPDVEAWTPANGDAKASTYEVE